MPIHYVTAEGASKPFSNYSQAVEIAAGSRILHIAGQVGAGPDGTIAEDERQQHERAWANVLAILAAAGMDERNLVDCHVYLTDPGSVGLYREIRDRMLKGCRPAATLLIVAGLASPAIKMEVSAVAAA
jgi:enamine deaminase RidA (YjgF/YER057c/UK114 family)